MSKSYGAQKIPTEACVIRRRKFLVAQGWLFLVLGAVVGFTQAQTTAPAPEEAVPVESAPSATTATPTATEQTTFYVGEFRVVGNSLLNPLEIEGLLYPHLGEAKTVADVEAARQSLELGFREAGYPTVFVDIPEQDVADGVVLLRVTEGKVNSLRITGSRYFSLEHIRTQVAALDEGSVPFLPDVQAQIAQLNRTTADRSISPLLRPGKTPGTLDVELKVQDALPLHGRIELTNRGSASTSRLRLGTELRYDNLWQRQHSLSLQYQMSPQEIDEVKVLSGTYLWRFADVDPLLVLYAVSSDSQSASVGDLTVIGKGRIGGVRGVLPLQGSDNFFHSLSLGFDSKDFDESITLQGADTLNTPINYFNWAVQYSPTIRGEKSVWQSNLGVNFGLRGIGNKEREFDDKRFGSKPNYLYLRGNVEHNRQAWLDTSLTLRVTAQIADSPLISNEQFGIGGAQSVRGYFESQALGDNGLIASIEWATPSFAAKLATFVREANGFVFVDYGKTTLRQPLPQQQDEFELAGAGLGTRWLAWKTFSTSLEWAWALRPQGSIEKNDGRLHASIDYTF